MTRAAPLPRPSFRLVRLTPPGRGAVAALLVEGPVAAEVVGTELRTRGGRPLEAGSTDRLVFGRFGPEPGEEVVVRRRAAESVEIHCHGGQAAVAMIEEVLMTRGAQRVGWQQWAGEHEHDPIAAAARVALAEARTERTAAILLDQHQGALRRALDEIEAAVGRNDNEAAVWLIDALLARADLGRRLVEPWRVVLAGRPNVGKSSLINALVGYARAIVHPTPGTTRDVVTAATAVDGWPVELSDTAGFSAAVDPIERAGIELARQRLAAADLVVLVFDAGEPWSAEDQRLLKTWPGAVVVHNKCDLPCVGPRPSGLRISATKADGLEALLGAITAGLVPDPPPPGEAVPFTVAQVEQLHGLRKRMR